LGLSERVGPPLSRNARLRPNPFEGVSPFEISEEDLLKVEFPSICNGRGKPRLEIAREKFFEMEGKGLRYRVLFVLNSYRLWVGFNEFLVFYNDLENKTLFVKARKRGNDAYEMWFKRRYMEFINAIEREERYFDFHNENDRLVKSPLIFATLTFRHYHFNDIGENVGKYLNRFMARLRKRIPHIYLLARVWQVHRDGWVHIHAILMLDTWLYDRKQWFTGFRYVNKEGKVTYRLSKHVRNWLKKQWVYGFSDFQVCDSLRGALTYLSRYLFQQREKTSKFKVNIQTLTYAICWIFRLRSFSLNYKKVYLLYANTLKIRLRLDSVKHNSNWHLVGIIDNSDPFAPTNGFFEILEGYPDFLT
jgi:hypothetical protein